MHKESTASNSILILDQTLRYVVSYLSDKENLFFSSYYARISFLNNKYKISGKDVFLFHTFRKVVPQKENHTQDHVFLGAYLIKNIVAKCLGVNLGIELKSPSFNLYLSNKKKTKYDTFIPHITLFLKGCDITKKCFLADDNDGNENHFYIEEQDESKELEQHLKFLEERERLPIKIGLFDIQKKENALFPSYYVLQPDYLIDVTSVSEAFDAFGVSVAGYGLKKMIDKGASLSLHVGNIANVILDELIYDPYISFNHFKNNIFHINPLAFATFTNEQVRKLIHTTHRHYQNIKRVVDEDFHNQGINGRSVYVEPSYYAPRIGIQGRFDLLYHDGDEMNIVELKSGKSYRPNTYGLNNSHYHQTLLYDLILESNLGKKIKRNNFILYSAESDTALRYAPTIKSEQREALRVRNRIYLEECKMQSKKGENNYISNFLKKYSGKLSGFKGQDINEISKLFQSLSDVEKAYWESSFAFLSKEYALSKIGDELSQTSKGLSGLWQLDKGQKHERFLLINDLKIVTDNSQEDDPHIMFEYTLNTVRISNFRIGDIIILYPSDALSKEQMRSQIFKCTLSNISVQNVTIRLRSKQMNNHAFDSKKRWNIERDILDSSFSKTFRQLYHFAKGEKIKRHHILGITPPNKYALLPSSEVHRATPTQNNIIMKAIASEDYYLIWGPPGTGKTSVILRGIIDHYYNNTQTRMLVIGYTNRAVDEICQAIEKIDNDIDYIRIGSKYSCGERYKSKLLNVQLESIKDRKNLKQLLQRHQIYVATLASIVGKSEIFNLLQFGICIVDEASQILEASIAGILTKTKKFVLIGDHLQLPAIVLQKNFQAEIKEKSLTSVGFRSYSESLFERLFRQCLNHGWTWAYSQLKEQGRMHKEIMSVVNDQFYQGRLILLPQIKRLVANKNWSYNNEVEENLIKNRLVYIPTPLNDLSSSQKVNEYEAKAVAKVVLQLKNILEINGVFNIDSIGIITPFRAQIAMIKSILEENKITYDKITIDTVERYQGGARDIIIMSTVVNTPFQLDALVSQNIDGVDRKLNVAISRAKEQFILIGNEEVLRYSDHYSALMKRCTRLDPM
ncbi:MAG: AAA domain-containing protein [Saprospiraceae bacterium]